MNTAGSIDEAAGQGRRTWFRQVEHNVRATFATLFGPPRQAVPWPDLAHSTIGLAAAVAAVIGVMLLFDDWALGHVRYVPQRVVAAFDRYTNLGESGYFLWPLGLVLLALAASDGPWIANFSRRVLAAWTVRLGFVFAAIGAPSLFVTIVKRIIGRARPSVVGGDAWSYQPMVWRADHASLPSGHATTAFAALVAIGSIFPQARALLWIYAVLIAISRVVLVAHYPSDVVAGAVVGAAGAWLVRQWFAARRLGFTVTPDGAVKPMPGPGVPRIVRAIARRRHTA